MSVCRLVLCFAFALLVPLNASALAIDLLGEAAQPLLGPAREKFKAALVYVWMQPYVGYGTGKSDQRRVSSSGAATNANGIKVEGFLYGGRGGVLLAQAFRVGVDFSKQSTKRNTLVEGTNETYSQGATKGGNTNFGAIIGFDIPYTPFQGSVARYFKAVMSGDSATDGEGWGYGISLVVRNPFILSFESRKLRYSSAVSATGKQASSTFNQYYVNLAFMLF